ncbi:MAG: hypothetical protein ACRDLB_06535 [Actinomycetota bacterium]
MAAIDLYWLPLGAGGRFVRFNGRLYEAIRARLEHREPLDLYHTALIVTLSEERFVVENAWPIPDDDARSRGVIVEGSVGTPLLGRLRAFRYEIRCWPGGTISDLASAIGGPQRISDDESHSLRLLELVGDVPPLLWGRCPAPGEEMWNSNSVISWLLERSGIDARSIRPPPGGRAPGWSTGIERAGVPPRREGIAV